MRKYSIPSVPCAAFPPKCGVQAIAHWNLRGMALALVAQLRELRTHTKSCKRIAS